jgi:hypothetical protein
MIVNAARRGHAPQTDSNKSWQQQELATTAQARRSGRLLFWWGRRMAFISISGEPGCRPEELARLAAHKLNCELVTEARLAELAAGEFGPPEAIAERAWPYAATSVLSRLGLRQHVVFTAVGAERLLRNFPGILRILITAAEPHRLGSMMLDSRVDRAKARELLRGAAAEEGAVRKRRFGRASFRLQDFDLVLNAATLSWEQMLEVIASAVHSRALLEAGLLSAAAESQVQFQARLKLAEFGVTGTHRRDVATREFGHASEEVFAHLLDFYRVTWEYEPRSFPLQWDKDGKVLEAFTPDFYLPEFDLYVEITTMKQANVTKKNRKIRLLRAIYPHVNIQIFYQKDFQDLVVKYGLPERLAQ